MKNAFYFISSSILLLFIIISNSDSKYNHNILVDLLISINGEICFFSLFFLRKKTFSLFQIFHVFFVIFFCIAPFLQFRNNSIMYGNENVFKSEDYIISLFLITIIILIFNSTYRVMYGKFVNKDKIKFNYNHLNFKQECTLIMLSGIAFYSILYYNNFNYFSILFRGGEFSDTIELDNTFLILIIKYFIQPIGIFIFLLATVRGVKHKLTLVILGILALLTAPPTGMPRFAAASLYLPVVLVFFPFLQKNYRIVFLLLFGLLFMFPFLNNFRRFSINSEISLIDDFDIFFLAGDFDAFQNFMYVIKYNIITYGYQLLGALFFWIPRSLWLTKPVGSGFYLADLKHLTFDNISMPFIGEAYINFGPVGIILFPFLLGYAIAYLDKYYYSEQGNKLFKVYYFILIGLFFYMLRGDLSNSFAYLCSFTTIYLIFNKLINKFTIFKRHNSN